MSAARSVTLPGVLASAAEARRVVTAVLAESQFGDPDAAVLVASELVANAVEHSLSGQPGGTLRVAVAVTPGAGVLIEVFDAGPLPGSAPAIPAALADGAERGRGLLLVSVLAADYGHDGRGRAWARVDREAAPVSAAPVAARSAA
jgi:anti-sigma regulatory factor (Ser/Thr protein kinase)